MMVWFCVGILGGVGGFVGFVLGFMCVFGGGLFFTFYLIRKGEQADKK